MGKNFLTVEQRVQNLERFLVYALLAYSSYYRIVNKKVTDPLWVSITIILFFIFSYFSIVYTFKIGMGFGQDLAIPIEKYATYIFERIKPYSDFVTLIFVGSIASVFVHYVLDFGWPIIIGQIIIGLFLIYLQQVISHRRSERMKK